MSKKKIIYMVVILIVIIASGLWAFDSRNIQTLVVSYVIDAVLFALLVLIVFKQSNKTKININPQDYKEWISEGSVEKNNRLNINIFTLDDLVRLAIDADKRVIHDSKLRKYYVFMEDVTYVHDHVFVNQIMENKQQIGKILLENGVIAPEHIDTGLYYQKRVGNRLGDSLVALGFIDETILYSTLAVQQKMAYYELDTKMELQDTSWLSIMSTSKARALQVLPLGRRDDGKLVIACGESAWSGIATALQEIFGPNIYIVAARPSHIYDILERIEEKEETDKIKNSFAELLKERKVEPYERLSAEEAEQFGKSYLKGKLDIYLFIKAFGLANQNLLAQIPDKEAIISWLTSKNILSGEITNMIIALSKVIKKQDAKARQDKVMPSMLDLLMEAHYITSEAVDWINIEVKEKKKPLNELLVSNYLVAQETIEHADIVINALKKITVRAKIF